MSPFAVEKARATATITLINGVSVKGCLFVSRVAATHDGPERTKELLNSESGFFPFELRDGLDVRTALYNRDHVLVVTLEDGEEPRRDPAYDVATARDVSVLMSNGVRFDGRVRVYCPQGHDRLSDFAREHEQFRYLEAPDATRIINMRHVVELMETSQQ